MMHIHAPVASVADSPVGCFLEKVKIISASKNSFSRRSPVLRKLDVLEPVYDDGKDCIKTKKKD